MGNFNDIIHMSIAKGKQLLELLNSHLKEEIAKLSIKYDERFNSHITVASQSFKSISSEYKETTFGNKKICKVLLCHMRKPRGEDNFYRVIRAFENFLRQNP